MQTNIVTQLHRLTALHNCNNDCLLVVLIRPLRFIYRRAAVQMIRDKIADRLRIVTDNCKVFAQVDTLYHIVHHKRFCQKTAERTQTRLRVEHQTGRNDDSEINQKQRRPGMR